MLLFKRREEKDLDPSLHRHEAPVWSQPAFFLASNDFTRQSATTTPATDRAARRSSSVTCPTPSTNGTIS
jgi:hypothetical protein